MKTNYVSHTQLYKKSLIHHGPVFKKQYEKLGILYNYNGKSYLLAAD